MADAEAHEFYADPANLAIAGPGYKRKRPRLSSMVPVRFSPQVIEAAKGLAAAEGMTVSSWIRRAVQRDLDRRKRERPTGLIPGSARLGQPKALRSSLTPVHTGPVTTITGNGLTFRCAHLSVGNVDSASCGICGPLSAVA
jgi:hypothetical protein